MTLIKLTKQASQELDRINAILELYPEHFDQMGERDTAICEAEHMVERVNTAAILEQYITDGIIEVA